MAEEEGTNSMSVKERIAALKLQEVGRTPGQRPPSYQHATSGPLVVPKARPPPPQLPQRPDVPPRPQSTNVPTLQSHAANGGIANQPEGDRPNAAGMTYGIARPALPPQTSTQSSQGPALPARKPSGPSPALPPRRPSEAPSQSSYSLSRKASNDSVSSVATARSSISGYSQATSTTSQGDRYSIRAPSYDPSTLPALPPKRTEETKKAYYDSGNKTAVRRPLKSTYSSPNIQPKQNGTTPPPSRRPSAQLPPPLPGRRESTLDVQRQIAPAPAPAVRPPLPGRRESTQTVQLQIEPAPAPAVRPPPAEPPRPKRNPLEMGFGPMPAARPETRAQANEDQVAGAPPPIPRGSRPDLSAILASKPKLDGRLNTAVPTKGGPPQGLCLHCRDFSVVDAHAARFPRQSVPNSDVGWLAQQLTAPFSSATDKARAIFTWHHHNIVYDTVGFFSGNIKPSTPQSTLQSGLAVCEGYAGLFAALAMKAGLEAYVVGGHGKGYGYSQIKPGDPLPPCNPGGHAWNAVKIDGGQWKVIDACWGAGHLSNNAYKQEFSPHRFTQSNDEFGLDHFPADSIRQYRNDGRTITWEEYIVGSKRGCGAQFFSGYTNGEGISEPSFRPAQNPIVVAQQGPSVRFSFQKVCPHWDPVRNGKGPYYLYTLALDALEGKPGNHIPFETNGDVWWCDVPVRDLGHTGQSVKVLCVTSFNGKDGRGLSIQGYRAGMSGIAWSFVAKWDVA